MQKKALIILCVLVLTSSGYAAPPAHAAIPVIDVDNITQQLKTYQETVKVVTEHQRAGRTAMEGTEEAAVTDSKWIQD